MANKAITLQRRLASAVEAAAHEHAERVASAHQRRMALAGVTTPTNQPTGEPPGEPGSASALSLVSEPPDLLAIQRHAAEMIAFFRERLIAAERAHAKELETDLTPRTNRDEAAAATFERLKEVRRAVELTLGPRAVVEVLSLSGDTPSDPVLLLEHADRAVERLLAAVPTLPALRVPGLAPEWTTLAGWLAESTEQLRQTLELIERERRRAESVLTAREAAFRDFRDVYVGYTKVLEGYYIAAGRRDLADRLRRTRTVRVANDDGVGEPPVGPPIEAPPAPPLPVGTSGEAPANEPGAEPLPAPLAAPGGAA